MTDNPFGSLSRHLSHPGNLVRAAKWLSAALVLKCGEFHSAAHVRWFAEDASAYAGQSYPWDAIMIAIVVAALLFAAAAYFYERAAWPDRLGSKLSRYFYIPKGLEWRIVAILTGIMLLGNATMGVYLAPNLTPPSAWVVWVGMAGQLLISILLLCQISFLIPGILILLVSILSAVLFPFEVMVDYAVEFVALAIALMAVGPTLCRLDLRLFERWKLDPQRWAHLSLPIIRVGVGLTLIILALHNKLLNPAISLAFLEHHHFNFMQALGFANFSDLHFSFAAGVTELTFGLLLLTGIATRFTTVVLSGFFVTTLLLLGPVELLGHAPLFGIALLLIIRGSGSFLLGSNISPSVRERTVEEVKQAVSSLQ